MSNRQSSICTKINSIFIKFAIDKRRPVWYTILVRRDRKEGKNMKTIKIGRVANGHAVIDGAEYLTCDSHAEALEEAQELAEQYKANGEEVQIEG